MIAYLKGIIKDRQPDSIIVDVNGVGYLVSVTKEYLERSGLDESIELYIYQHLRENISELFGFEDKKELFFFKQLIGINGVGPKAGLAIISTLNMEQVKTSIIKEDASLIKTVSGIGAKTSERIVLELKNKIFMDETSSTGKVSKDIASHQDVIEALVGLGYTRNEAIKTSQKVPADLESTEEKVKYALQNVNK